MTERRMQIELHNGRVFVADVMLMENGNWVRIMDDKAHEYEAELLPRSRIKSLRYDYRDEIIE